MALTFSDAADGLFGAVKNLVTERKVPTNGNDTSSKGFIGTFTQKVNDEGMAHHHLFLVSFGPRKANFAENDYSETGRLNLFCHSTSIPALNIMTAPYRENAAHYEVPYGYSHEPVTMNFYGDASLRVKEYFDQWYYSIVNPKNNVDYTRQSHGNNRIMFIDEICKDISIFVIPKDSRGHVYAVKLVNAYPKSVGNIDMSHQNTDIISFPVQFTYQRIETLEPEVADLLSYPTQKPRAFPISVWDKATEAASEIIQSATRTVENVTGQVADALTGVSAIQNEITGVIRGRVTPPLIPPHNENV